MLTLPSSLAHQSSNPAPVDLREMKPARVCIAFQTSPVISPRIQEILMHSWWYPWDSIPTIAKSNMHGLPVWFIGCHFFLHLEIAPPLQSRPILAAGCKGWTLFPQLFRQSSFHEYSGVLTHRQNYINGFIIKAFMFHLFLHLLEGTENKRSLKSLFLSWPLRTYIFQSCSERERKKAIMLKDWGWFCICIVLFQ